MQTPTEVTPQMLRDLRVRIKIRGSTSILKYTAENKTSGLLKWKLQQA